MANLEEINKFYCAAFFYDKSKEDPVRCLKLAFRSPTVALIHMKSKEKEKFPYTLVSGKPEQIAEAITCIQEHQPAFSKGVLGHLCEIERICHGSGLSFLSRDFKLPFDQPEQYQYVLANEPNSGILCLEYGCASVIWPPEFDQTPVEYHLDIASQMIKAKAVPATAKKVQAIAKFQDVSEVISWLNT